MNKPIVHYRTDKAVEIFRNCGPNNGCCAMLYPLDHPSPSVSNLAPVVTSDLVAFEVISGRIETQNTIYMPQP